MLVEEIMKKDISTLFPTDTIADAMLLIKEKRIRHIPIIDEERHVVGIITDRDIRDASPSIFHLNEHLDDFKKPVETIMKRDVITGHPLDFVEEIAAVFYEQRISCMPILQGNRLVGIVTETDLLHTLVQLTGANQPGSQIEVKVPNRTGVLSEVAGIFTSHNISIQSVLVYPAKDENHKILVFRVRTINPMAALETLKEAGYAVCWPHLPEIPS